MLRHRKIIKLNFLLKIVTLFFIFSFSKSWGQATLPVSRTSWGSAVAGWTTTGTSTYGTEACSGSAGSSCKLDNAADNVVVNYNTGASNISFCVKGNTGSGAFSGTFLLQESTDGVSWSAGQNIPVTTTGGSQSFNLSCSSTYVRFYFSVQTNGNIALDDVSITQGTCTACSAPTTTMTPTTQTVCAGSVNTLTVTSSATIPSYTWQASSTSGGAYSNVVNGTPAGATYSGTNTAFLSVTGGSTYYYRCLVADNGTCTATSSTSTLVVNTAPSITLAPVSQTVCSGSNASFTTSASGSPVTYQWYENSGSGNTLIAGATTKTLTLSSVTSGMNTYSYQCVASVASCSSVSTTPVVLNVNQNT